ncbi:MAG: hypothetical protein KA020_00300 [Planctomycetes bacterium]|jgi:hypothetical protein|nr:hypothetical protein [Planctomycetota bacterium]MCC7064562.1 hypothetical protein [Planctomycetota bacterium]
MTQRFPFFLATLAVIVSALLGRALPCQAPPWGTPSWTSYEWKFPTLNSPVFEPVEVFPREPTAVGTTPDPGVPANTWPLVRLSGLRGFRYDCGTPLDPNDDKEYMVVGRSDGLLLVDATPLRDVNPSLDPGLPAHPDRKVVYIPENPTQLLPASNWPSPNPNLRALLEGLPNPATGNLDGIPYLPPGVTHAWSSGDTTNREVAIYHSATQGYFIYSVSVFRDGVWVVHLIPDPLNVQELVVDTSATYNVWVTPPLPAPVGGTLSHCHNIDVDVVPGREALYVTDEHHGCVVQLDLANPASPSNARVITSGATFHDATVHGNVLITTRSTVGLVRAGIEIYNLGPIATAPTLFWQTSRAAQLLTPAGGGVPVNHSVYVDTDSPFLEPRLYTLEEDLNVTLIKRNYAIWNFNPLEDPNVDGAGALIGPFDYIRAVVPYVVPTDVLMPPNFRLSPVHNLRGLRRTGFVAQYAEGLGLLDLQHYESQWVDPTNPGFWTNQTMASFDTTSRTAGQVVTPPGYPTVAPANAPYATASYWSGQVLGPGPQPFGWSLLDAFLGCWDAYVQQDSGLVYSILGPNVISTATPLQERLLSAGVFRVRQGHMNRYWDSTPFPAPSPNTLRTPRLIMLQGPPREGQPLLVGDENAGKYAASEGATPLHYQYTLIYSTNAPMGNASSGAGSRPTVKWDPDPSSTSNNDVFLNVDGPSVTLATLTQGPGPASNPATGWFSLPNVLGQDTRWYCQLLVQEYRQLSSGALKKTGRFAASRGNWFGVGGKP